jgi:prepilin-type N-terminal cleavage/methylation domain-containing protein
MKKVKGFTLIEMGIVIFILSVLTGMIVPRLYAFIKEAEKATDISNGKLLYTATLLVVATDDDVEVSFFNTEGAGGAYNHKIPQYKTINGE